MNLSDVDLNLFVVFDAIYTEGNLTKAGQVVGITQPAVSNALARLRETFDDQLFVRSAQGMTPTLAAQNIIGSVRHALQLLRNSVQTCSTFDPSSAEKTFRFSTGSLGNTILQPKLFGNLSQQAPSLGIESFFVARDDIASELASGRLDFAIDTSADFGTQVHQRKLIEDRYVCLVNKDHICAERPLTLETYAALSHVLITHNRKGMNEVDQALNKLGKKRCIVFRTQHAHIAPLLVGRTDLALTVPNRFAQDFDELAVLELPFDMPPLQLYLYWHETSDQDPANQWMRDLIMQTAAESSTEIPQPKDYEPSGDNPKPSDSELVVTADFG